MSDETQEKFHPTQRELLLAGQSVRIKSSFNGASVFVPRDFFETFGLPPIREGINDLSVEDWYYSRLIKAADGKVGVIDIAEHTAYNDSQREKVQPK